MNVEFADDDLARVEVEAGASAGFPQAVVKAFRKRMQQIRAAADERDFYAAKSLHFERLSGKRSHQHSMMLNDQYRLILELEGKSTAKIVRVITIEDYH